SPRHAWKRTGAAAGVAEAGDGGAAGGGDGDQELGVSFALAALAFVGVAEEAAAAQAGLGAAREDEGHLALIVEIAVVDVGAEEDDGVIEEVAVAVGQGLHRLHHLDEAGHEPAAVRDELL